ncbi:MAG: hypothetical protein LM583_10265 [Desulfurococcaceae archaeon]|nr:hypothetical protein [Desulfurococcaceae archaeon]
MSELSVCSKLKELASKAEEVERELLTFYGWQPFTLYEPYGRIAQIVTELALSKSNELRVLGEKLSAVKQLLARIVFYSEKAWHVCSKLTVLPSEVMLDIKCTDDGKLATGINDAISTLDDVLSRLENAHEKCIHYVDESKWESETLLGVLEDLLNNSVALKTPFHSDIQDLFDWIVLNFADAVYLLERVGKVYTMFKEELEAIRSELEKLIKPVKEEKKEGGK